MGFFSLAILSIYLVITKKINKEILLHLLKSVVLILFINGTFYVTSSNYKEIIKSFINLFYLDVIDCIIIVRSISPINSPVTLSTTGNVLSLSQHISISPSILELLGIQSLPSSNIFFVSFLIFPKEMLLRY